MYQNDNRQYSYNITGSDFALSEEIRDLSVSCYVQDAALQLHYCHLVAGKDKYDYEEAAK